jgi:hypothetical protein
VQQFNLVIKAGDLGGQLTELINGPVFSSYIDLTGVPDSSFNVTMIDVYRKATPVAAQSQPGEQNAEDLIAAQCAIAGLTFDNSARAHAVLRNPSTYGSTIDQIAKIANAAGFSWKHDGNTISIWQGATIDDVVIDLGPNTDPRMVGYPSFSDVSLIVTSEYNPQIQIGRQMNVTSSIPNAKGLWQIILVEHNLTTVLAKGSWFTTAHLIPLPDTYPGSIQ